ncbi:GNAT superfamily N-acetyltransferase [Saccharothrix tamanrassetensis]|uniref:GNAT superfamily N-acetyltransferase n=1 Tax=Saccharothrix tamanrassetensis TaxID=1051531 RepID=A0A841CRT2_9PSEU|nr:GNAT family N-acetyltransferase [Saccharothrix tamanrassetensis]MBB5958186.1 GNAT superfamily N-acetyltransferase [Saccharothrix tamanrassetensis]
MEIRDDHGLAVAIASVDEALGGSFPDVTVVRVPDPPRDSWEALAQRGFLRKPAWLTWLSPTCGSDAEWLAQLTRSARNNMRGARRRVAADLRVDVRQPVTPELLDDFLVLYEAMVATMPHGVTFASSLRDAVLADERHFAVYAVGADGLAGCVLCREDADSGRLLVRFSAFAPRWRQVGLARVLYAEAVGAAREKGYRQVTLGNDPNLYGHIAQPGLFAFKAGLGFTPVPAPPFGVTAWRDEADLVRSLTGLGDLALVLSYTDAASDAFRLDVHSRDRVDLTAYTRPFVVETRWHSLS